MGQQPVYTNFFIHTELQEDYYHFYHCIFIHAEHLSEGCIYE
jgi:hypothetical protein